MIETPTGFGGNPWGLSPMASVSKSMVITFMKGFYAGFALWSK
jgi:hypothetical protein